MIHDELSCPFCGERESEIKVIEFYNEDEEGIPQHVKYVCNTCNEKFVFDLENRVVCPNVPSSRTSSAIDCTPESFEKRKAELISQFKSKLAK